MPITIPNFTTSAVINGNTLISQADEQLNILMTDVENYVESTYQTVATNLEGAVGIHVTTASNFATQAEDSATNAALLYDMLTDIYLGVKASDPTLDNDGNALQSGALYFNSVSTSLKVYNDSTWYTINTVDAYSKTEVQTVLPRVGFDTTNVTSPSVGQIAWNIDENTLDVGLNGASLLLGQEQLIRVRNSTASTISNGTAVMATGTIGNSGRITVAPANINSNNAKFILGIVTESILAGADGFCTVFGKVRGIQTNGANYGEAWVDGDVLYVKDSGNGALTKVVPTNTQVKLPTAIVVNSHVTNGTLFVRVNSIDENQAKAELALKANIKSPTLVTPNIGVATGTSFNSITGLASVAPLVAGTATVGTSTLTARQDHVHPVQTSVSGNAGTATTLATSRLINGVGFNGSADINIEDRLGTAIASAATTTVGTVGLGDYIHITGTTTITSLGTAGAAGIRRTLIFDGALTLTHNATSLICPGAANIVTVAGTVIEVVAESTANWRVVSITHPSLSIAELGYLNGVTSDIQTQLNAKAALASPALTGTPTAPTAAVGTSTTQIASTAFVNAEIANDTYSKTEVDIKIVGFKNLLINPNFMVNQRAYVSGTATTTANQYCHDRWRIPTSGQNVTFTTVNGVTTVTAPTSGYEQIIENINNIGGTFFLSNQGTATATISQSSDNVTYTNVIPNADGSYTITGANYIKINFASGTIIKPQFEQGTKATIFENRSYALEDTLCKRYFEQLVDPLLSGACNGSSYPRLRIKYQFKRVIPSLSVDANSAYPKISDFYTADLVLTTKSLYLTETANYDNALIGFNQAVFSSGRVIHGMKNNLLINIDAEIY